MRDFAPLPIRLMMGFGFAYHGYPKLFTPEGHGAFMAMLQQMGIPAAGGMAWAIGLLEFFGGLALIAGAFVTLASILLIAEMLVALFKVHLAQGFNFIHITGMTGQGPIFGMPGYEVDLLYIAGLLTLILGGAGAVSLDRLAIRRRAAEGRGREIGRHREEVGSRK